MMAGVVRRDGLREKVIAEARKYAVKRATRSGPYVETVTLPDLARVLDAVPDVPPTHPDFSPDNMTRLREAALQNLIDTTDVPPTEAVWCHCFGTPEPTGNWVYPNDEHADTCGADVPPDPPAAEVGAIARLLDEHRLIINYGQSICRCGQRLVKSPNDSASHVWQAHHAHVAAVISGVLVDAADVRARAQEAAWDEGRVAGVGLRHKQDNPYRDRAVSERDRTTT